MGRDISKISKEEPKNAEIEKVSTSSLQEKPISMVCNDKPIENQGNEISQKDIFKMFGMENELQMILKRNSKNVNLSN